jgi:hypothetical protein
MALEHYANIAEIVGVILVVVTLVFLTLQIRQNTKALRSTTIQSVMQSELAMMSILVENAATWEKISSGSPLANGEETRRAIVLFNVYMIETESRYHQFKTGYLDAQPWEGRLGTLPAVVRMPVFELWRASHGGQSHAADFLALLDELVREGNNE